MEVMRVHVEEGFLSSKEVQSNWAGNMGNKKDNHKEMVGMDKKGEEMVLVRKWQELEWLEEHRMGPLLQSTIWICQAFSQHAEQRKDLTQSECWSFLLSPYTERILLAVFP